MAVGTIITEREGVPLVTKSFCRGFMLRIVHPQNPKAPSESLAVTVFYLHPGGVLEPHRHAAEEVYAVLEGEGKGYFGLDKPVDIRKGMYIHIPPDCEHGMENTGNEILKVLCTMSPPNPPLPEWKSQRAQG